VASNKVLFSLILAMAMILIGGIYLITQPKSAPPRSTTSIEPIPIQQVEPTNEAAEVQSDEITDARTAAIEAAPVVEPAPEPKPEPLLPPLNNSDTHLKQALGEHSAFSSMSSWLTSDEIIRKSVVAIDNLAKGNVVAKYRPVIFKNKSFVVENRDGKLYLDRRNYNRYNTWIDTITSTDINYWGELITTYKPWLDLAFQELGYKDKTFTGQLDLALKQIIQAPLITTDLELIQPSVLYKYADKKIEKLPGIQKLMIRMGPENSNKLKHWASALREHIAQ